MHTPVLLQEVLDTLNPKPGEFFVDGTLGAGGHASAIIEKIVPGGTFLAVDRDELAIEAFRKRVEKGGYSINQLLLLTANYAQLETIISDRFESKADGILLDLGISSDQLGTERAAASFSGSGEEGSELEAAASAHSTGSGQAQGRGFSFLVDDPLLMTYEKDEVPVYEHLKRLSEKDLAEIIRDYSQERYASKIARAIKEGVRQGEMKTTFDLVAAIKSAVPMNYEKGRIHPATRTFMALRIYANKEMEHLDAFLSSIPNILAPGGRLGVISFHSLEDRKVKQSFKELAKSGEFEIQTKKAITASLKEMDENPRSRSAKYRVLIRK